MGPSALRVPSIDAAASTMLGLEAITSKDPWGEVRQDSTLVYSYEGMEWFLYRGSLPSLLLTMLSKSGTRPLPAWTEASIAPSLVLMRVPRGESTVAEAVKERCNGTEVHDLYSALIDRSLDQNYTLVAFTSDSLLKSVRLDSATKVLLVPEEGWQVYERLRVDEIWYYTMGVPKRSLVEYKINITDTREQYTLQRDRLILAMDALDAGLILGELWTTDYPRPFLPVLSYQLRLFSPLDYKEVKKILVALEFLPDGTRIVDYDLYHRNSKINWIDIASRDVPRKDVMGVALRLELESRLPANVLREIQEIEQQILSAKKF